MDATLIDDLAERIERLLLRHEELLRTQALLEAEVRRLAQERERLLAQCRQARDRLQALAGALDDTEGSR